MEYKFVSDIYKEINCFLRVRKGVKSTQVILKNDKGEIIQSKELLEGQATWIKWELTEKSQYLIELDNVEIGEIYLSECPNIIQKSISYLVENPKTTELIAPNLQKWYDVPEREQYHFTPFKNWMNDPNGLCFYQGFYHMFYQKNPFDQVWGNMYWGHALSKDLMHWRHLPVAFEPQEDIIRNTEKLGGAFSGSICEIDNKLVAFFTRDSELKNGKGRVEQYQVRAESKDSIHFDKEKIIIPSFSVLNASHNFRDPKITYIDGSWYIVLGSQIDGKAAILLYKSYDLETWNYLHPLLIEEEPEVEAFECPDFFYLDGKYVAVGAWMSYKDKYGRFNPTRYYIGDFVNEKYTVEESGFCDFGCDYYAIQSFYGTERRISMGWITDWYNRQKPYTNGSKGSMSLPRELHIIDNHLYQQPAEEIYSMIDKKVVEVSAKNISLDCIDGNAFLVQIEFEEETDFNIVFARSEEREYSLMKKGERIEITGENSDVQYIAPIRQVQYLEIFVDRRMVEIFINHGECVGTKMIATNTKKGLLRTNFKSIYAVRCVKVSTLKSAWEEEL